ncbi:MAG: homoserine kinase [Planctomycetota bacterium]|nr:homoserine kinase [Planctomycetota bacterium]
MSAPHKVRVPASTSNLGPGFDLLGLCLNLYLQVELSCEPAPQDVDRFAQLTGEASGLPRSPENLVVRAFNALRVHEGHNESLDRSWAMDSEIPVARGLGSSGAATAAGLLLACQTMAIEPKAHMDTLVRLGTELEGHPDNVVASLVGGCVLTIQCEPDFRVLRQEIHPDLAFAVAWGNTPLHTATSRRCLPTQIPFEAALDQPRRLAALLEGLRSGDPALLRHARTEHLHQGARLPLIAGGSAALDSAHAAGAHLATISGSGSSLIAIGPHDQAQAMADALGHALQAADAPAHWRVALPV